MYVNIIIWLATARPDTKTAEKTKKLTIISEYTLYKSLKITIYPNKASP